MIWHKSSEKKAKVTRLLRREVAKLQEENPEEETPFPVQRKRSFYDFGEEKSAKEPEKRDIVTA